MHYVHTDHLGSLNVITSQSGSIEQEMSFDAWGNRRDPNTWQNLTTAPTNPVTDRGFTGHEHMDGFKLINMNGRVYDPVLGRFLSADPYVQSPEFTQSYNRYSYVVNNPLSFTDPSGYYVFEPQTFWQEQVNTTAERGGLLPSGNYGGGGPGGSYTSIIDWDIIETSESYSVYQYSYTYKYIYGGEIPQKVRVNSPLKLLYSYSIYTRTCIPVYGYTPTSIGGHVSGDYGGGRPSIPQGKGDFRSGYVNGLAGGAKSTWKFVKGIVTFDKDAWITLFKEAIGPLATAGEMAKSATQLAAALPDATSYDYGYGAGFVSEKLVEAFILRQASRVNPFGFNNGYGFKIGRTEFLYENPSVGGGTIFSYKSLSGGKFRLDFHRLPSLNRGNTLHFHTNYWGYTNSPHRSLNPFYFGRPIN